MAEETKSNEKKAKKRTNKLTNARIKKEIEFLTPMFAGIDDEDKKSLVNSLVEEAAFLKVACFQAKEELKKEGLTTETVNASQKFVKAHPSATIYDYSQAYLVFAAKRKEKYKKTGSITEWITITFSSIGKPYKTAP